VTESVVEAVAAMRVALEKLAADNAQLRAELEQLRRERDEWKREAERLAEALERIRFEQKTPREHVDPNQVQLAFDKVAKDLLAHIRPDGAGLPDAQDAIDGTPPGGKKKRKHTPHGRSELPEHLPVETIIFTPKDLPDDAVQIGEDVSWRLGFRRAAFYRLKVVRPRFAVPSDAAVDCDDVEARLISVDASKTDQPPPPAHQTPGSPSRPLTDDTTDAAYRDTTVVQVPVPSEIIERGLPTADTLAHILLSKFADKLPFNRQTGMYHRDGVHISRGTMCQWNKQVFPLVEPLVDAMADDARANADVICTDATGVLVQAKDRCKHGTFWVYVSDNGHVLFRYAKDASGVEPKKFFAGYEAIIIADATSTLDAICNDVDGPADRGGCLAHARRYFYKAIETDRDLALVGLGLIGRIFELEPPARGVPPAQRLALRQQRAGPVFRDFITWCEDSIDKVEPRSRIYKAMFYASNNQTELGCFLRDGRVPLTNNVSERELRRLVIGRANWLFVGSDDSAPWTAALTSLIGSCARNGLDPAGYLRDLFRVLPHWPKRRLLELCPRDWPTTRDRLDPAELALPLGPLTIPPAS